MAPVEHDEPFRSPAMDRVNAMLEELNDGDPPPPLRSFQRIERGAVARYAQCRVFLLVLPPPPPRVQALVQQNPVHPAEEPEPRIEAAKMLVRLDEGGLGGVVRVGVVAEHPERHFEEHPLIAGHQCLERLDVAPRRQSHKRFVVGVLH